MWIAKPTTLEHTLDLDGGDSDGWPAVLVCVLRVVEGCVLCSRSLRCVEASVIEGRSDGSPDQGNKGG